MDPQDRLVSDALALPEEQRAQLALRLLDSLEAPDLHGSLDDDAFSDELARRAQSVLDGNADERPFDEVDARIRGMLGR